jgi:hypothetical protein
MRLENGDLSELPSRNLCRCIHHASRMGGSWLNFTSVTPLTLSSMQLISAFGFNTIQIANFSHHSPQWKLISSIHLILWLTKPIAINFQHSKKWVNLTHRDTFIQGPFDFSSINGRKTRGRVSQMNWDILKSHCHMFHNLLPSFDVPSYSIHVDQGAHVLFHDAAITRQLISMASHASEPSGLLLPP